MSYWPAIVFGWPAVIPGALLLLAGAVRQKSSLSLAGAVLVAFFCMYLALMPPPLRWLALAAIAGNAGSYIAVRKKAGVFASLMLTPFFALVFVTGYAVVSQDG